MKKKFDLLAICSFALALGIFIISYILFHHWTGTCFTSVFQVVPAKPMVTLLFSIWGTHFLFAGVMSLLIGHIFFKEK